MALRLDRAFLRSRLARRVFLLFVVCALVPMVVTSVLSYLHVRSVERDKQLERLQDYAKTFALTLLQRFESADGTIRLVAQSRSDAPLAPMHTQPNALPFVHAAAVVQADGTVAVARGAVPELPPPNAGALSHIESGRSWMTIVPDAHRRAPRLFLAARTWHAGTPALVYFELAPSFVFGTAANLPYDTTLSVTTLQGTPLQTLVGPRHDADPDAPVGTPARVASRSWELLLSPHFATDPWVITAAEPLQLGEETSGLQRMVPLGLAAAVLLVLWLSATQIRRSLVPLEELLAATRRIASRRFDARVQLSSGDEFEQLGESFNRMSDSLRVQFAALEALAEIDRLILTSPDIESILERLLAQLRAVADCRCASVTLIDRDDPEHGRVYFDDGRPGFRHSVQRIRIESHAIVPEHAEAGALLEIGRDQSVPAHVGAVAAGGAQWAFVQPVRGKTGLVAILVLGHARRPEGTGVHRNFARDFADRLAVALTNLEREERLYLQAHYDELTQLPNRQLFKDRLAQEIARAGRTGENLAVLYVDLDNFKRINDTLGHSVGDELLATVAQRLGCCIKQSDTMARLGGDEFVAILTALDGAATAGDVAARLLGELGRPLQVGGREYHVRASIGIALYPDDGRTIDELLKNADTAMYRAKDDGRGRVTYFEPHMNARALERWSLETGLHRALQSRQFVLHYQPQFNLRSGEMSGAEALIRWMCPVRGERAPMEFIPAAEEMGLIADIGAWVLTEACQQYRRWQGHGISVQRLGINVSAEQLQQADFVDLVRRALLDSGMPPWALELEITERVLLTSAGRSGEALEELVALGVRIALDDFGTGYSSMSYLRRHPVHIIKIDRSFITGIPENPEAAAITTAIVAMARSLNKETTAEGIETAAQLDFLKSLGCDSAQGYFFAKPLPADELARFVSNQRALVGQTIRKPAPFGRIGRA